MLPDIIQAAITLVNGLITGLIQNLPMIVQAAMQLVSGLMNSLYTSLPQIITCALDLVAGLVSGLISAIPMLIEAIPQLVMALVNGFIQTDWLALGASILQAIWNGILSIKDALVTSWSDIFSSLFAKFQNGQQTSGTRQKKQSATSGTVLWRLSVICRPRSGISCVTSL